MSDLPIQSSLRRRRTESLQGPCQLRCSAPALSGTDPYDVPLNLGLLHRCNGWHPRERGSSGDVYIRMFPLHCFILLHMNSSALGALTSMKTVVFVGVLIVLLEPEDTETS